MSEAVKNVGNVANEAGLSFEQLSAIIAKVMEKTRQDGASIGNALRTILVRISKANKLAGDEVDNATVGNAAKALHKIGIEVCDTLEDAISSTLINKKFVVDKSICSDNRYVLLNVVQTIASKLYVEKFIVMKQYLY